ncbi:response regulator transcription factor [Kocuria sp. LUK]|uniref:Two-component system response regulator n=1 Tax=Kocuria flava TaxID=446860 RepID=A0A2N4T1Y0_9MICC|nr:MULTISPECIES: response regulator transcription factor [Kocuria]MCD1146273.1 response regulator transcription factor [Kocuria sp. LUK]PLC12237.1 two-component system response regulator [Kocuria flava]
MASILIAEDEERISRFIQKGLRAAGYTTTVVEDGPTALDWASTGDFDLLVLDVGLPGMDGFTVLSVLRSMGFTLPVIMCTARDSVEDTVAGLDKGADDYLAKPFRFQELLARVRARLRERAAHDPAREELRCGSLSLDVNTRCAVVEGREVELSAREFAMARAFVEHPGQVLTREQLLNRVWGHDFEGSSNVVDVYVRYLRTKLGPERIVTVRGAGYRLAAR